MRARVWVAVVATLAITGCEKSGKDLALVGREKITEAQLDAELRAGEVAQVDNPAVRKAALQQIITRKLLAQAARRDKLDRTPEHQVMKAAAVEAFDAGLELRAIRDKVAKPTPAEVQAFVQGHPEMFAQRTGYLIDQVHVQAQDKSLMAALQPTKSLPEVEQVLQARGVPFRKSVEQLDALRADPRLTAAIRKLGPGEPFILGEQGGFTVSAVRQTVVQPVVGPQATAIATEIVMAEHRAKATADRLAELSAARVRYPKDAEAKKAPAKK